MYLNIIYFNYFLWYYWTYIDFDYINNMLFLWEDNFIFYFIELKSLNTSELLREVLIIIPLFIISQFMQMYLEILIIYYLNPMYCLMLNNICYGTQKIIFFILDNKKEYLANFILLEISEYIALFVV